MNIWIHEGRFPTSIVSAAILGEDRVRAFLLMLRAAGEILAVASDSGKATRALVGRSSPTGEMLYGHADSILLFARSSTGADQP
jgi:hypothetical protein